MCYSVRAHSRHWIHMCVFRVLLFEKGIFYLLAPSNKISFLTMSNNFFFKTQVTRWCWIVALNKDIEHAPGVGSIKLGIAL